MIPATFEDVEAEFEALDDWDDRYRLLIDLGRALPAMPEALKTDATRVRGCASQVWLYPSRDAADRLHFVADSDAAIVKGLIALVLLLVQDRPAAAIDTVAIRSHLDTLGLSKHLSSNRTQGLASMIARIGELARA